MRTRSREQIRRSRRARPTLEALDGRQLLAILVTSGANSGPGTLRAAIQQNNAAFVGEIRIQEGVSEIVLTSGTLNATSKFRLIGPSSGVTIRRSQAAGTPEFGLFNLNAASVGFDSWRFENLSLVGGAAGVGSGGAISATNGDVALANCTVADNTANNGAGISVTRTVNTVSAFLSVSNSTFRNNRTVAAGTRSAGSGGGIASSAGGYSITSSLFVGNQASNGAAVLGNGAATLANSTVVGNTNTFGQGVVSIQGGPLDVVGSTITGNQGAPNGNGTGFIVGGLAGSNLRLTNTIVAGNIGGDLVNSITVGTNNLIGDGTGGLDPATNLRNVDPKLGPLRDNGGPTLSMMPLPGSPAIDAGTLPPIAADVDQRYAARPINDRFDIGAVETGSDAPSLFVTTDADSLDPQDGLTSLREAIAFGNRLGAAKHITFDPARFGTPRTITLAPSLGALTLRNETVIDGPAVGLTIARSTVAGTPRFGLITIPNDDQIARTTLRRLTLTGGDLSSGSAIRGFASTILLDSCNVVGNRGNGNGGAINGNELFATNSSFLNNFSTIAGGALQLNSATLTNCTFAGNTANSGAGAINAGAANLTNCTIVGNTSGTEVGSIRIVSGTIQNSIVADNVGGDLGTGLTGSGNLIGDGTGGLVPAANLLNVRPNLSPLQTDVLTSFFIPLPGSPARDGGVSANVPAGVATDQRGFARIRGARVDIGSIEVDAQVPAIASVSASVPDGPYGTGRIIPIVVRFSRPVIVQGTPTLALNSGGTAAFSSGSGTGSLTFLYTVRKGDAASKLEATALNLGSAVIRDNDFNPASITLPAAGASGSIGSAATIVIDTAAPQVLAFRVLFGSRSFDVLSSSRINLPWRITGIQAVFSKPVASGSAASLAGVAATGLSGLGTSTLTWTFGAIDQGIVAAALRGTGPAALADGAGNTLAEGLGFGRTLRILAGDANDDGMVSISDVSGILGATKKPYDVFSDINGDGVVNLLDVNLARSRIGRQL